MHSFIEMYKNSGSLHHAYYFVEHELETAVKNIKNFLSEVVGLQVQGNPDFFHKKYENFTVDDASHLSKSESRKDLGGDKKIFIIETDFITEEAQNALLKVFEEPTPGTHFFIISPQDILLPTLRSRMQVYVSVSGDESFQSILSKNLKEKMDIVKEITDGIKDEEKTKQDAISFLNQVEKELYVDGVEKNADKLNVCVETRASLYDRGAPIKMILENLVLSV